MSNVTYSAGNLTITVAGLDTVEQALGDLKRKTPAAAKVAINATARQARKLMVAKAKTRYAVNAAGRRHLKDLVQRKKASNSSLMAELHIAKMRNDLGYFKTSPAVPTHFTGMDFKDGPSVWKAKVLKSSGMKTLPGAGGIPVGTGGRALLLLSGGIDSPVAGYMMAKRGLEIAAVHFASPPYTSDRARQKVLDLAQELTPYTGRIRLFVVPFTKLQELLRERCPEDYFTILMRRYMMRVAERIALREDCGALITGESLGQVASQTMQAIGCTDLACRLPVLRPCIGMDKEEIVRISRKIETFETSILPYEDCCTVFTPRHPKTKPTVAAVEAIEAEMAIPEELVAEAAEQAELNIIRY